MNRNILITFAGTLAPVIIVVTASAQNLVEGFDVVAGTPTVMTSPPGWFWQNTSTVPAAGINPWFQGNAAAVFPSVQGAPTSYAACNWFRNAGPAGSTLSVWMVTPEVNLQAGGEIRFWTRAFGGFPDRMQVRLSLAGASTNVGTDPATVGDFSTLLLDINPDQTLTGYPLQWQEQVIALTSGQVPLPVSGRIAFRYYVEDGGQNGTDSNYIGVDRFSYAPVPCLLPLPACNADVNGTGRIDIDDLLAVISSWGPGAGPRPIGDVAPLPNGDCLVNIDDLLAVIAGWGSCADSGCCRTSTGCVANTSQAHCIATLGGAFSGEGMPCPSASNDSVVNAIDITASINGAGINGDNTCATPVQHDGVPASADPELPAGSPTCHWQAGSGNQTNTHNTMWYRFTAPANGSVTVGVCASVAPLNDTIMALYSGTPGSLSQIACDEDACTGGAAPYYSRITASGLSPGTVYHVLVANPGGWGGSDPGPFVLTITSP